MPTLCLRVRQLRPKRKPMRRKLLPMPLSNSPPPVTVLLMEVIRLTSKVLLLVEALEATAVAEARVVPEAMVLVAELVVAVVLEAMRDKIRIINLFSSYANMEHRHRHKPGERCRRYSRERESVERESCLSVPYYLHLLSILVDQITKCCEEGNRTVFLFATIEPPHKTDFIIYFSCEATLSYTHTTYHLYYILYLLLLFY
mmetsp:Transcript_32444/g.36100  ORF Transcript_32444/g.36100 Transcript_32444/m.36100 type:complete len:201 (-) Transcript_32444:18-620(-)